MDACRAQPVFRTSLTGSWKKTNLCRLHQLTLTSQAAKQTTITVVETAWVPRCRNAAAAAAGMTMQPPDDRGGGGFFHHPSFPTGYNPGTKSLRESATQHARSGVYYVDEITVVGFTSLGRSLLLQHSKMRDGLGDHWHVSRAGWHARTAIRSSRVQDPLAMQRCH